MRPYVFQNGTAVLTGAASGIGRALARGLAVRGSHLALIDRDEVGLNAVAAELRERYPALKIGVHPFDLSRTAQIPALADAVLREHPRVTLLINNAGVALGGTFEQLTLDEFEWVMDINFRAVVALTKAFLPALRSTLDAQLVNVSSLFGLIGPAGQSAYSSSKFAVRGFSEVLRHELTPQGVGVTTVFPGGVRTNIARNARVGQGVSQVETQAGQREFERLLRLDPAQAAEIILHGTGRRQARVLVGNDARLLDWIARLLPGSYGRVLEVLRGAR
ncbi:SDR family NAD(P)-dependent oxidoreductase (plasmid) [Deinococcus metallilatus]|uniref:SDR family NAD(P)-dependent oxidoreductase n=1 Tax=Deinococcus metallilatus TaxID=1211322 RepID=A0AAJ5F6L2_9DEIO|nr:SDR family NAD(P)-dependent oxidoreductase [Deinococcus metallilatus]MBB5297372.1 short-subunit dehydrogenase [Deinococcus metallilatus]QBY06937.1 SDR family NAD(P)-dependent oxidoreductase [Deinococcus metallilatus]TLK32327.1 SDR family NAD(P)-dependent oxidoreductase [Deinococcus metallilatus]GMA17077.1 acetoin dehydrogenase [Deinococcus metallilatus]